MKKAAVITGIVLLTIATTFLLVIYNYFSSFSNKGGENGGSQIQPKETKSGEPFNMLLLGVDIGTVGSENSPKRSDTMIVFHYDPGTSEMSMVSIPRDTRAIIRGNTEKINAANVFGGTSLAISTVENLLGIDINYYVEIDYEGFREIVDAIGGIDIVIPYNMNYDDNTQNLHIHFKKGQNVHLDGEKAEEYVRWRKNNDNTGYAEGDIGRINTQQEFIMKILEKMKSSSLPQLKSVLDILPKYVTTNMGPGTMINLALTEFPKMNINSIQKYTLKGEPKIVDGLWYFIYNPVKSRDIVSLLGGKVENNYNETENKDIRVQILDGSGIDGAGKTARLELEEKGYTVVSSGTITGTDFVSSYIIDKTLKGSIAKKISEDMDIKSIEKDQDTLSDVDVLVILGKDRKSYIK